jgi:uncharacterized protein (DUF2141 family)
MSPNMTSFSRSLASAAVLGLAVLTVTSTAHADTVTIRLEGVRKGGGDLLVSLNTEENFMKGAGAYNEMVPAPAQGGSATVVFKGVKPGRYALNAMHDQDGDRKMKQGANGMPQEGFAMKNGEFMMGPPNWAEQSFDVGAAPFSMTERMVYFPGG